MHPTNYARESASNSNFDLIKTNTKYNKKFYTRTTNYNVIFKNIPTEFIDSVFYMNEIMQLLVKSLIEECDRRDKIKIIIDHPVLTEPIELPFVIADDLTSSMIMAEISKVVQSNKILTLDNNMVFNSIVLRYLQGGGGTVKRLDSFLYKKQSIIRIKPHNNNKLCAIRAIIVGKAISDNDPNMSRIKDSRNSYQNDEAIIFAQQLNLNINNEIGIDEIKKIEDYLVDYQIIIFDNNQMNEIMYSGRLKEKKIFLFYHDKHFDVISSLPGFYGKSNYCFQCMKAYETFINHPCNKVCKKCRKKTCKKNLENGFKKCESCFVICSGDLCYSNHLKKICSKIKKCEKCGAFKTYKHNCDFLWCNFCKKILKKIINVLF